MIQELFSTPPLRKEPRVSCSDPQCCGPESQGNPAIRRETHPMGRSLESDCPTRFVAGIAGGEVSVEDHLVATSFVVEARA